MSADLDLLDHLLVEGALAASSDDSDEFHDRLTRFREWFNSAFPHKHTSSCLADCGHTHSAPITLKPVDATGAKIVVERVIQFDGAVVDEGVGQENIAEPDNAPAHSSATGAAEAFWDELTEDDRVLLPDIRTPVRQLAAAGVLGLKKSALASRQAKLERRVTEFALGSRDGATALRCLLEIQQSWSAGRSTGGSP